MHRPVDSVLPKQIRTFGNQFKDRTHRLRQRAEALRGEINVRPFRRSVGQKLSAAQDRISPQADGPDDIVNPCEQVQFVAKQCRTQILDPVFPGHPDMPLGEIALLGPAVGRGMLDSQFLHPAKVFPVVDMPEHVD